MSNISDIIHENKRRHERIEAPYNPISGEGGVGERVAVEFKYNILWLPKKMIEDNNIPTSHNVTFQQYVTRKWEDMVSWDLMRFKYDFEYWAVQCVMIKDKMGYNDIPLKLNRPQRRLLAEFEDMRCKMQPIRLIMLKARQWGGSTLVQMYMAWIQIVHRHNWHSLVCAHVKDISYTIKSMYTKLLNNYPERYCKDGKLRFHSFERSSSTQVMEPTDCRITIGTAESPDAMRGNDIAMVHMSEVAYWKSTPSSTPEDINRAIYGTVNLLPYSLICAESTANGKSNYFYREYTRAERGESDKRAFFVPWYEIDIYQCTPDDIVAFVESWNDYEKELWRTGATIEAICWYRRKNKEYVLHEQMMSEYPTTESEAFTASVRSVFNRLKVDALRGECFAPKSIGEMRCMARASDISYDKQQLTDVHFEESPNGKLSIWEYPDVSDKTRYRYVAAVDIGGRSDKSDYSCIAVIDREAILHGGAPRVVAQWYGHAEHYTLAWHAARIAQYYNNALLVIESNSLETEFTEGDHGEYILEKLSRYYKHLYYRVHTDTLTDTASTRWGFHTNRSSKTMIINNLTEMINEHSYVERDMKACNEYDTYEYKSNGSMGASEGAHDDILMTRAIALYVCFSEPYRHSCLPKTEKPLRTSEFSSTFR